MRFFFLVISTFLLTLFQVTAKEYEQIKIPAPFCAYSALYDGVDFYYSYFGVFKSTDMGQSFTKLCSLHCLDGNIIDMQKDSYAVHSLYQTKSGILLAAVTDQNIIYSQNDGVDWFETTLKSEGNEVFWEHGDTLYLVNYGQLYLSPDSGKTWEIFLARQHVANDKMRDSYLLNDTLYLISKDMESQNNCIIRQTDLNAMHTDSYLPEIDIDYLYSFRNELCAYDNAKLYRRDASKKWTQTVDITQKIKALFNNTNEYIYPLTFMVEKNIMLFGFWTKASIPETHMEYAVSYDNGESWILVNWNNSNDLNTEIKVVNNNLYIVARDFYRYDKNSNIFTTLGFKSLNIFQPYYYRDTNLGQMYCDDQQKWYVKIGDEWLENKDYINAYMTFGSSFYKIDDSNSRLFSYGVDDLVISDSVYSFEVTEENIDYDVMKLNHNSSGKYCLVKNGEVRAKYENVDGFDIDNSGNFVYYKFTFKKAHTFYFGNVNSIDIDSIALTNLDTKVKLNNFQISDNKLSFESNEMYYVSLDKLNEVFSFAKSDFYTTQIFLKNQKYYVGTKSGLLESIDGKIWNPTLEIGEKYSIYSLEFSPDNRIYIYTDKGLFITDIDVSIIEQLTSKNSEISIFPNPAADFIEVKSKSNIEIKGIWRIDGKSCIYNSTNNTLYLNDLPNGQYILEVLVDGIRHFKKFAVVR